MADPDIPKASFSPYRRWSMGLHVTLLILVVLSVVIMVNYLAHDYFVRSYPGLQTKNPLSTRTIKFLQSLTNHVQVTIYFDKNDPLFGMVSDLLNEYKLVNSRISVQAVDMVRDAAEALSLKEKYKFLASSNAKNQVIFDCEGRVKAVDGNALSQYVLEQVPNEKERAFRRKPVLFAGERAFTAGLLAVTKAKPLKAYFLQDDGEHSIDSDDEALGYLKLGRAFLENYVQPEKLSLLGTNTVPSDCNLLVIAGPTDEISETALEKIDQYLNQGGRLWAMFSIRSIRKETGLEKILAKWGVNVGTSIIKDPDFTTQQNMSDMKVMNFTNHPIVNPLEGLSLQLYSPRAIGKIKSSPRTAEAPRVEEIARTGPRAFAVDSPGLRQTFPLMVAVEKGAIKGVTTERGTTRIVVTGDSIFLGNHYIDSALNRDFANYTVNWLLEQRQLLDGLEPRPVAEYRIVMTRAQLQTSQWLMLAGMPGVVLAVGSLVWLRRRR